MVKMNQVTEKQDVSDKRINEICRGLEYLAKALLNEETGGYHLDSRGALYKVDKRSRKIKKVNPNEPRYGTVEEVASWIVALQSSEKPSVPNLLKELLKYKPIDDLDSLVGYSITPSVLFGVQIMWNLLCIKQETKQRKKRFF